jgi:predicted RNase H-like HicB family nuclease
VEERSLKVEVHREEGMFWAQVSEWPGCFASGETLMELLEALEEAIAMYVTPDEQPLESIKLRMDAIDLRVGSERPLRPARAEASAGPLATPPRSNSPHRDWGFGRFDRRPH